MRGLLLVLALVPLLVFGRVHTFDGCGYFDIQTTESWWQVVRICPRYGILSITLEPHWEAR